MRNKVVLEHKSNCIFHLYSFAMRCNLFEMLFRNFIFPLHGEKNFYLLLILYILLVFSVFHSLFIIPFFKILKNFAVILRLVSKV
jgi:hypothetical protein